MEFPYAEDRVRDGSTIYRPVIPVRLKKWHKEISVLALVDSGADHCCFGAQIAKELGLHLESGTHTEVIVIGGRKISAYVYKITLEVGGWLTSCDVYFIAKLPMNLLGHRGFFDKYTIKFDYRRKIVELFRIK